MLLQGFFAVLPSLEPDLLRRIIERELNGVRPSGSHTLSDLRGGAEFPRAAREPAADLAALVETDQFRAALGRIACMYDGGHLLE